MEGLRLRAGLHVRLVYLCKNFIVDGAPTVVFKAHVPAVVLIVLGFIEAYVD